MGIEIRKVSLEDGENTCRMLQQLPAEENGFGNCPMSNIGSGWSPMSKVRR